MRSKLFRIAAPLLAIAAFAVPTAEAKNRVPANPQPIAPTPFCIDGVALEPCVPLVPLSDS